MDDDGVVADRGGEGAGRGAEHEGREDDEGIGAADEEAVVIDLVERRLGVRNAVAEVLIASAVRPGMAIRAS